MYHIHGWYGYYLSVRIYYAIANSRRNKKKYRQLGHGKMLPPCPRVKQYPRAATPGQKIRKLQTVQTDIDQHPER